MENTKNAKQRLIKINGRKYRLNLGKMVHNISFLILNILSAPLLLWIFVSWLNVNFTNLDPNTAVSAWNFFEIMF